jgi:hypothetical protein
MMTWEGVCQAMNATADVVLTAKDHFEWTVKGNAFAWERPLRKSDLAIMGPDAPKGPILAIHVSTLGHKDELIERDLPGCFTIPHFSGYPAVLICLDEIDRPNFLQILELAVSLARDRPERKRKKILAETVKRDAKSTSRQQLEFQPSPESVVDGNADVLDGDPCIVVAGSHKGKSGTVQDRKLSKSGVVTITVIQFDGQRFKTLARNVRPALTTSGTASG